MGLMNKKHRKNILREANKLMKLETPDFDTLAVGAKETLQDAYISKVCEKYGWELHDFYHIEGKELDKLLG